MMLILLVGVSKLSSTRRTRRMVGHRSGRAGFCGDGLVHILGVINGMHFEMGKLDAFRSGFVLS
jgi:hypothetical protein